MLDGDAPCGTGPTQGPDGLDGCVMLLAFLVSNPLPKCGMTGAADLSY